MSDAVTKRYPENDAPIIKLDLEAQIARAEAAVIARDRRVVDRTGALAARIKHDAIRHAGGGALLGLGTVALTWWLSRLSRKHASAEPPAAAAPREPPSTFEHLFRDAGLALAGLLPMLWPLLPRTWRRVVTPNTASTLLTFIAPLLGRLFRHKPVQSQTP
jgi:uncharacterized protein YjeT (DUF2065 family)